MMDSENQGVKRGRSVAPPTEDSPRVIQQWQRIYQKLNLLSCWTAMQTTLQALMFPVFYLIHHMLMHTPMHSYEEIEELENAGAMLQQVAQEKKMEKETRDRKNKKEKKHLRESMEKQFRKSMGTASSTTGSFVLIPTEKTSSRRSSNKSSQEVMDLSGDEMSKCYCGTCPTLFTCRQDGPNWMRQFYRCSRPRGSQCQYFKWIGPDKHTEYENLQNQGKTPSRKKPQEIPLSPRSSSESSSQSSSSAPSPRNSPSRSPKTPPVKEINWEKQGRIGNGCNHRWSKLGTNAYQERRTCKDCGLKLTHVFKTGELKREMPSSSSSSKQGSNSKHKDKKKDK